jgi:hypothetical protein
MHISKVHKTRPEEIRIIASEKLRCLRRTSFWRGPAEGGCPTAGQIHDCLRRTFFWRGPAEGGRLTAGGFHKGPPFARTTVMRE